MLSGVNAEIALLTECDLLQRLTINMLLLRSREQGTSKSLACQIVISDFGNCWEGNFYDLAVSTLNFDAGGSESLCGLHAANRTPHASAIRSDDLHIVFAIEWLQSCKRFSYFHNKLTSRRSLVYALLGFLESNSALYSPGSLSTPPNATGKHYLAYRNWPCILRLTPRQVSLL